ncbi:MAG: hypothetical protein Pg6C_04300 [Treponemataceae bacterium]|nr:MAG: hypothetical protein Pg6C_04300 [Treponemataceae bacterium]
MKKTIRAHNAAKILFSVLLIAHCSLLIDCKRERRSEKPRAIEISEVFITGAWKDYIEVVPGTYTLEDGGTSTLTAQITVRLRLKQPYPGNDEDSAYTFRLMALNKNGSPAGDTYSGMQITTREKFNEFVRGRAGDAALITFQEYLSFDRKKAKVQFAAIAAFDGKTIDPPKRTAKAPETAGSNSKPAVPASAAPGNTDTASAFNPRTEARTGRRIVAVPELTATKSISEDMVVSFTAAVTSGLVKNASINRVVDYNQINRIMKQHKFEASDWSNPAKYAEIGKALNVDTIAVGTLSLGGKDIFGQEYVVSVQLIDISTMAIAGSYTRNGLPTNIISGIEYGIKDMKVSQ